MNEMSSRLIAAWLECVPEKSSWCRNEQVCQGRKSVKRFERSDGLDTAVYKTYPFLPSPVLLAHVELSGGRFSRMRRSETTQ